MKKIPAVLTAVLLIAALAGCGGKKPPSAEADTAVRHLERAWENYLSLSEKIYSAELWALDYTDRYLETNRWEDLSRARTACINTSAYLKNLSPEIKDLSEEDYDALLPSGIDISYQSNAFSMAAGLSDHSLRRVRGNLFELHNGVFFKSGSETLKDSAAIDRETVTCYCRYDCATVNYQLADLEAHGYETDGLRDRWKTAFPTVFSCGYQWLPDTDACEAAVESILDEIEKTVEKTSEALSQMSADLYRLREAKQNGTLTALFREEMNPIDGLPQILPAPLWYQPQTALYQTMMIGSDETVTRQDVGTDLGDKIYTTVVLIPDADYEGLLDYVLYLKDNGFQAGRLESGLIFVMTDGYNAVFEMSDNDLMITFQKQDVTFVPDWYYICYTDIA